MFTRLLLFILVCVAAISLVWCQDHPFVTVVAISIFVLQIAMSISDAKRNESYNEMKEELKNTKHDLEMTSNRLKSLDKLLEVARGDVKRLEAETYPNPYKVGDTVRHASGNRKMVVGFLYDWPNVYCEWMEGEKKCHETFDFRTLKKTTKF